MIEFILTMILFGIVGVTFGAWQHDYYAGLFMFLVGMIWNYAADFKRI